MASFLYPSAIFALANGALDFNDSLKVMLVTSAHMPNKADDMRSDIADEASGTNYAAGGKVIDYKLQRAGDETHVIFDPVDWPGVTLTDVDGAIIYKSVGTPSGDPLICFVDLGDPKSVVANTFQFNPTSPLKIIGLDV